MFTRFLTYERAWQIAMLDDVERIRSDPSYNQKLALVLVDLADTGSTDYMINQPNGFKIAALFFWLNLMEFIVNFSIFTRGDQRKLVQQIRLRWAELDNWCLHEIDQLSFILSDWNDSDIDEVAADLANNGFYRIRRDLQYLCKPVPAWNTNPWMWKPFASA